MGIGFGIFGFIIFIINLLTGVFTDNYALKTRPYEHIKPNTTSVDEDNLMRDLKSAPKSLNINSLLFIPLNFVYLKID